MKVKSEKRFAIHFKTRLLEKSLKVGRHITLVEVSEATGIPYPTIARWNKGVDVSSVTADTLYPLMDYFNCELTDLVTAIRSTP